MVHSILANERCSFFVHTRQWH